MFYTNWVPEQNRVSYVENVPNMTDREWWNETVNLKEPLYGYTLWVHEGDFPLAKVLEEQKREAIKRYTVTSIVNSIKNLKMDLDGADIEEILAAVRARL